MATGQPGPVVVADDEVAAGDRDSTLESIGNVSPSGSLTSSILGYRHENGRTYHRYKEGKYNLPNDAEENERLDLQHHLFLLTFENELGLSPPNLPAAKVGRVLDVGTGTGIWAVDFGDEHPESEVIGVDLSPIQPSLVPPNVTFLIDDIDEEWTYDRPFDYIHSRMMNFSIEDWKVYLTKIYNNLSPGGYVELQEMDVIMRSDDGTLKETNALWKWSMMLQSAAAKLGRAFEDTDTFKDTMTEIGFVDVVETQLKWPTNRWPEDEKDKEIGAWSNGNANIAVESLTMAPFTRAYGWTGEEVRSFLADVRKELNDPKIHAYWTIASVYGRRPQT